MENLNTEKKTSLLITKKTLGQSALKTETERQEPKIETYYQDITGDGVNDFVMSDVDVFDIFY